MKIAIAGYGIEGKANYDYWNTPENEVVIVDERELSAGEVPLDANVMTGQGVFERLNGFDLVVRTAGLAPRKIITDGKIWSATNEFFAHCPAPIIGVTGSKGKGTTCSLIAAILTAAGKTVHLVGNIGAPALAQLATITADDLVVYELSSFQLWDIERAPNVAVVLHIEPDHLDIHADFGEYVAAKARITLAQTTTDRVVYNANNSIAEQIARGSVGQRLAYPSRHGAHVQNGSFYYGDIELCSVDDLQLPGAHNQDNACAALTAVWPWVQDGTIIAEGLRSFNGLPHRLQLVGEVSGVRYYDDSIATTPGSTIAAIAAFTQPKILILGGSSKGADFTELASAVASGDVRQVVLIGDEAERIAAALDVAQFTDYRQPAFTTMAELVRAIAKEVHPGDVVILSPACASFGLFANYADRGDQFSTAVRQL